MCSSAFVTSTWITTLYGYGPKANPYLQLDRSLLSKYHQIINNICTTSKFIVEKALSNFNSTVLVSFFLLSRASIESQMNAIIEQLAQQTPLEYRRVLAGGANLLQGNLIPTTFSTDWLIEFGNVSNGYLLRNIPRMYANGTCNCVVSNDCQESMRIGPPDIVLPGLFVGCFPIDGLKISTLECFYSSSCINTILSYLEYYTLPDKSPPTNFTLPEVLPLLVNPLNKSISSHFSTTTPIGTMINELFIEEWKNISSYESYYVACAPTTCNYDYSERRGILYVITSLLALYGGLTVGLRSITWNGVRMYYRMKFALDTRHIAIAPRLSTG